MLSTPRPCACACVCMGSLKFYQCLQKFDQPIFFLATKNIMIMEMLMIITIASFLVIKSCRFFLACYFFFPFHLPYSYEFLLLIICFKTFVCAQDNIEMMHFSWKKEKGNYQFESLSNFQFFF